MGLWVMTAGVMISLYMGYMHGVNTGLGGPGHFGHFTFFGPVRPFGIYYIIFYIYWGVGTTLMGHDCGSDDIAIYGVIWLWYN